MQPTTGILFLRLMHMLKFFRFTELRHLHLDDLNQVRHVYKCSLLPLPKLQSVYFGFALANHVEPSAFKNQCLREVRYLKYQMYKTLCALKPPVSLQLTHFAFKFELEWSEFTTSGHYLSDMFPNLVHLQVSEALQF